MTMAQLLFGLAAVALSFLAVHAQDLELKPSAQVPGSASGFVDRSYLGLMVETTSWARYASTPFSVDLI